MPTNPKVTTLGTPCARSWTQDWIDAIDAKESQLNHRICGARLPDATPCCNASDHPSGRCQFHGGFDLTGAPPGNRNAHIHGLYSRRLRTCTPDCPLYQTCPCANNRHPRESGDPSSQSALSAVATAKAEIRPVRRSISKSGNSQSEGPPSSNPQSVIHNPQSDGPQSDLSAVASAKAKIRPVRRGICEGENPRSEGPPSSNPQSEFRNPQSDGPQSDLSAVASAKAEIRPVRRGICKGENPRSEGPPSSNPQSEFRNPQFPTCPYQLAEYNTVLTDALAIVESQPHPNPMGIHAAHNVATLQVLVSNAAAQLTQAPNLWSSEDPNPQTPNPTPKTPNPNTILAFTRLMREFRASLKLLQAPAHPPLNRQNYSGAPPTPDGILRHAERIQHDTGLDPDSQAAAQLPPQTPETHAKAYIQRAPLAGGQGRDIEMCEAFDEAARIDEEFAESERDHVLASYRPAKQSVSEELAEAILGHLHLPPLPENEEEDPATTHAPNQVDLSPESAKLLQDYLDLVRDGKVPPEAYPIGSPARAAAERNSTQSSAHQPVCEPSDCGEERTPSPTLPVDREGAGSPPVHGVPQPDQCTRQNGDGIASPPVHGAS